MTLNQNPVYRAAMLSLFFLAFLVLSHHPAVALDLCVIIKNIFTGGNLGKGIATMGVLAVGIGAAFGKVTWTTAVLVVVGIAVMFGAGALAQSAGGGCTSVSGGTPPSSPTGGFNPR
jgi:type IV secretory pathway VirB2 component (pilin)